MTQAPTLLEIELEIEMEMGAAKDLALPTSQTLDIKA